MCMFILIPRATTKKTIQSDTLENTKINEDGP